MRKALLLTLKAALSVALLYFSLRLVDIGTVATRLSRLDPGWGALGMAALVVQTGLLALRWHRILNRCGADLPVARMIRFVMIANFFNQTLPSSFGGDFVRIWLAGKATNWRAATYSVFLDRVVGLVALAAMVVACLPWSLQLVRDPVGRAALLVIGLGSLAAALVFVGLAWERLSILQRWSPTRHLAATANVALHILRSPSALVPIGAFSVLIHLLTAVAAWCAARAVGADLPLLDALFLVLPVVLILVVPISIAGWGVRESAMVAAFSYAGLPQSDGLIVSLLIGAGALLLGVAGGVIWIATTNRAERRMVPEAVAPD
jgi:uncharacterized membrane protein YbhN (UPF0104 family)